MRRQLTLFVPPASSGALETVRRELDPVQADLIAAHATLCREDELVDIDESLIRARLATAGATPIALSFGSPEAFQGHGVRLPCVAGEAAFEALRRLVLDAPIVRRQQPHITLAHPRNPRAPANVPGAALRFSLAPTIRFTSVALIEQDNGSRWRLLEQYSLAGIGTALLAASR